VTSSYEKITNTPDKMRRYQQERAIESVTALIQRLMAHENVSRADLARKLDKSPGWITQLLDGERNKTVRTLSDVFWALGQSLAFGATPLSEERGPAMALGCQRLHGRASATYYGDSSLSGAPVPAAEILQFPAA
jgi:hypothetical protein